MSFVEKFMIEMQVTHNKQPDEALPGPNHRFPPIHLRAWLPSNLIVLPFPARMSQTLRY